MSNEDKYIFRLTDTSPFLSAETIGYMKILEEERIEARKNIKETKKRVNKRLKELENNEY